MQVYYFLLVWTIGFGIMLNMASQYSYNNGIVTERKYNIFILIVAFLPLIIFTGARSNGVADTAAYIGMFESYPSTLNELFLSDILNDSRMKGFIVFSTFIKQYISTDYNTWLFIIAIPTCVCIMMTLKKYSTNIAGSIFLFMASCQFIWLFNGMRQYLVVAILFACTPMILNKQPIPYFIIVLILSAIHTSAIIMIPMYFIVSGEPWNKKTMIIVAICIFAIVFADRFLDIFNNVMEETDFAKGLNANKDTDNGTSLIRILVESIPTIIAFIWRGKLKDKYTPIMKISVNMSIISTCIYIISKIVKSGIMVGRLPIYLSIYNLILLPWLIDTIFEGKIKRLVYYIMILSYLGFFYYQMEITWRGFPYTSKILKLYLH